MTCYTVTMMSDPIHSVDRVMAVGARRGDEAAVVIRPDHVPYKMTVGERERSQGFATGYTDLVTTMVSARKSAVGNSMAPPVMAWIARRALISQTQHDEE